MSARRDFFVWRGDSGQDFVEFALVIFPVLLILFAILEFGLAFMTYETVANAAREGARVGVIPPAPGGEAGWQDEIKQAVKDLAVGLDTSATAMQIDITGGSAVTVKVTYQYHPLIGTMFFESATVPLVSSATMRSE